MEMLFNVEGERDDLKEQVDQLNKQLASSKDSVDKIKNLEQELVFKENSMAAQKYEFEKKIEE